jgi:hypothetical protein
MGLPVDKIFDLSHLRKNHKVVCEVSSLSIKKSHRGKSGEIFHPLVRFMWNYAHKYFGVDYFAIAVNPSMFELYESIYLFRPLPQANQKNKYEFANNNPAVGEYINVKKSFATFERQYQNCTSPKNLYEFMKSQSPENEYFPNRQYFTHIDAPVTPTWFKKFKKYLPKEVHHDETLNHIAKSYGYRDHKMMSQKSLHEAFRLPVSFEVLNYSNTSIKDVSQYGIRLVTADPLLTQQRLHIRCQLSHDRIGEIVAEIVWKKEIPSNRKKTNAGFQIVEDQPKNTIGLKIIESSDSWKEMLTESLNPLLNKVA